VITVDQDRLNFLNIHDSRILTSIVDLNENSRILGF
jgi:hypothetical protein